MAALGPEDESQWGRQGPEAEKSPPRRARRGPCPPPYPQHESLFLQGCQGSPVGKVLSKNLPNLWTGKPGVLQSMVSLSVKTQLSD